MTAVAALAKYAPRYRLEIGEPEGSEWLRVDRILEPGSPELTELLKRDDEASCHRTAHANALSMMSFYAGRAPATALLLWALEGRVLDIRPQNLWVRPHDGHGIASVAVRSAGFLPGGMETLYDVVLRQHLLPLAEGAAPPDTGRAAAGVRRGCGGRRDGILCRNARGRHGGPDVPARALANVHREGTGRARAARRGGGSGREARLSAEHVLSVLHERGRQRQALRVLLSHSP
ncbi:hypothetical protein [Kribbella pratensis]|uniref:hypothetical protein n=1 Tax=Kribbella pratensis TaxID=2512112 RepID=UPI001EDFC291|nr:hypothetical protein [Kribbella pratensis]